MLNLYGNVISNVRANLAGGSNYEDHYAIFEQGTRNTGLGIAEKILPIHLECFFLLQLCSNI